MNGLIVVNKDINVTSRDVVNKLNKILNTKKIGHTGTLDPIATGVLVCLIGKYTKLVPLITSYDKEYIATIKLGIKTDTGDITGNILEQKDFNITKEDILNVFNNFPKEYVQTVPIYSAVKVNGKKLYEYARTGEYVELPKREVKINCLELLDFSNDTITFKANVSKGTYIRALIEDICEKLNVFGTMSSLIRTKQGNFNIEDAKKIEDIENNNYRLQSIHDFLNCEVIEIPDNLYKTISNGGVINNEFGIKDKVIFTYDNKDIAIYEVANDKLKPFLMF